MITITGEPQEIAALVVALQERRNQIELRVDTQIPNRNANDLIIKHNDVPKVLSAIRSLDKRIFEK